MHVHGLQGKFAQPDEEVISAARDCLTPMAENVDDRVMPAFSSGQWAGTAPVTWRAIGNADLLFMSGGGIMAHPDGPAAGVASIRQAWDAVQAGTALPIYAETHPELAGALAKFGRVAS
jgi:ribulose-bisphosphate carboxylase large chain